MGLRCWRGCIGFCSVAIAQVIGGMVFKRVRWSHAIGEKLAVACRGDEAVIASEVLDGLAVLWEINGGESYMVTRVEGPELVIVCYQGARVRPVMLVVHAEAVKQGYRNVRFHTRWLRLIDMFRDLRPETLEYVVRIPCNGRK